MWIRYENGGGIGCARDTVGIAIQFCSRSQGYIVGKALQITLGYLNAAHIEDQRCYSKYRDK